MTRKKSKTKGRSLNVRDLKTHISKLFKRDSRKRLNAKQVIKKLKIENSKDSVQHALEKLTNKGILSTRDGFKYQLSKNSDSFSESGKSKGERKIHQGYLDMTRTGSGYVMVDGMENDVYVPAKFINGALHGDKVEIAVFQNRRRQKPDGQIKKVLERSREFFIGTLKLSRNYGIIIPDRLNMPVDIYVDLEDLNEAKDGEKVIVKITKWPSKANKSPIGRITTVLGKVGSHDVEMQAILINNGFNLTFPDEVIAESETLEMELSEEEIGKRRDMRAVTTFTIDPDTAKDFDDALSIQRLDNGDWEVGVHIADVTHYVKENTALDKEAFRRSTSVYLVDRVLPMLPEMLSNELCSLRPKEDKFTFSAVFTFDEKYKVKTRWFGKTITHSDHRFAYEDAQKVMDEKEGLFVTELLQLNTIATKLRKQKFKNGAIAFEAEEVKFRLDENGTPIDVYVKERKDTHLLIEDFMLLANREVAAFIAKTKRKAADNKEIPFVYRVHDTPDPDKVAHFAQFAKELGHKMVIDTPKQIAKAFNDLAKAAKKDGALKMLEPLAIRTMAKAVYTTENIGHYGLGFEDYSHFTSPIRRYSDVLTHRLLYKNLGSVYLSNKETLEEKCKHISKQERKAMDAERESVKYKQVEYIGKRLGEEFDGVINGIIDRGFFVELVANKCEGMVSFGRLTEAFEIGDGRLSATGTRTGQVIKMGDKIKVRVISADLAKRQIELEVVEF